MITCGVQCVVLVLVLMFLPDCTDTEVPCVVMETCMLPCSFQAGGDPVVHWMKGGMEGTPVHSYHGGQDQLGDQDQNFRGRTKIFSDEISRGNASLQLMRVKVQDEGSYLCYTSTLSGKESYITIKVNAPVREVNIQQEGNRLTCSSEGIYPKPELTWTTSPPSTPIVDNPTVHQTEQQLFSISSSLTPPDEVSYRNYKCSISSGSSSIIATFQYRKQDPPEGAEPSENKGPLIGGVSAVVVTVIIGAVAVFCYCKKRNVSRQGEQRDTNPGEETNMNSREESGEGGQTETDPQENKSMMPPTQNENETAL